MRRLLPLTLEADLFASVRSDRFDNATFATSGGLNTIDVVAPSDVSRDHYRRTVGASMRFVCESGGDAPLACMIEIPGGQRHHRDDSLCLSLRPDWTADLLQPLISSVGVARHALWSRSL